MPLINVRPGKEAVEFRSYEMKHLEWSASILRAVAHLDPRIAEAVVVVERIVDGSLGPQGFNDTQDELAERNYQGPSHQTPPK